MRERRAYRLPEWARIRIQAIAEIYDISQTDALLRLIDTGSKWYRKTIRAEIKADFDWMTKPADNNAPTQSPDTENYKEVQAKMEEAMKTMDRVVNITKTKWIEED